jgi:Tol biopolymer transport system component
VTIGEVRAMKRARAIAAVAVTATVAAASGSTAAPAARITYAAVASNLQYGTEPPAARFTADLVSIRPDGRLRRQLTRTPAWEDDPAWSSDRRRLAFTRGTSVCHAATCTGSNDSAVWVAYASGAPPRRLTRPPDGYADSGPAWSPDGGTIAFVRRLPTDEGADDGVYLVDAGRGVVRRLTSTRAQTRQLAWSPDGRTIAVGLVLVDVRTGASTPIGAAATAPIVDGVAWSPDGRHLAFTNDRGVHVVSAASDGHPRLVVAARFVRGVAWSPDGRRLAFAGRRTPVHERTGERIEPSTDLYLVGADGRGLWRLTATPGPEFSPSWR